MGIESQAIDILTEVVQKAIFECLKSASFDVTKPGTITAVLDNNKYSVRIEGTVYTVPSITSSTYNVNDAVSVLYPQNNNKRKRIIGREV